MRRRRVVARILLKGGLLGSMAGRVRNRLAIVNYHRLRPDGSASVAREAPYPYDADIFGPTVSQFGSHLGWLARHTTVLSERELLQCIQSGEWPARLCTMVTFDDGYVDNHQLACPELARRSVPATFFIATGLIDRGRLGWWDLISYSLKRCRGTVELFGRRFELPDDSRKAAQTCTDLIKEDERHSASSVVGRVVEATGVASPPHDIQRRELMTWEQIEELLAAGNAIGSHTVDHPVLSRVARSEQRDELFASKRRLEERLANRVRTFAYPVGGRGHFTSVTETLVVEAGYQGAFSFNTGVNRPPHLIATRIRRFNGYPDLALLAAHCAFPRLVKAPS